MSKPTTKDEFKEFCLRKLGKPVIKINIDDTQIDDRIDEALSFWYDYHFDGTDKVYYKYQLQAEDFTNRYITLPENIIGVVRLFNPKIGFYSSNYLFDAKYQLLMNEMLNLSNASFVQYYQTMQHLQFLEEILNGSTIIRFNKHKGRLYIDEDWAKLQLDQFILIEAYEIVDPETYSSAWSDRMLQEYATVLIKENWANNLKKFGNMLMPGNIVFNGQQMYNEAIEEKQILQQKIMNSGIPPADIVY